MSQRTVYVLFIILCGLDIASGACTDQAFGTYCQYNQFKCRCDLSATCDPTSGECSTGCAPRWMGPACQYGNVAFNKTVSGSFANKENITDGDRQTCASGNSLDHVSIDLTGTFIVQRLIIYNQDHVSNPIYGLSVYVSSQVNDRDGSRLCHEQTTQVNTENIEIKCRSALNGRYIQVVLPDIKAEVHICEIKIYGGLNIAYKKTTRQSSTNPTHMTSSKAVDGGYIGLNSLAHTQLSYQPWWYVDLGRDIQINWIRLSNRYYCCADRLNEFHVYIYQQTSNFDHELLNVDDQSSLTIDIPVVKSVYGNKVELKLPGKSGILNIYEVEVFFNCPDLTFGIDCQKVCKCNDTTEACDKIHGYCDSGCPAGYTGKDCYNPCVDGKFGYDCVHSCNCELTTVICTKNDGRCIGGCRKGYTGYGCLEACVDGNFGVDCQHSCNCKSSNEVCDKTYGLCKSGCADGYIGEGCLKECHNGNFGPECKYTCNCKTASEVCRKNDGNCTSGCRIGYEGNGCLKACGSGKYGQDCSQECNNCNNKDCNHVTGICNSGCKPGYLGDRCQDKCDTGSYGRNCSFSCINCNNTNCTHVTGSCNYGCIPGYTGELCSEKLKALDDDGGDGSGAIIGAVVGVVLAILVVVAVVFFVLWRRRRKSKGKDHPTEARKDIQYSNAYELEDNQKASRKRKVTENVTLSKKRGAGQSDDGPLYEIADDEIEAKPTVYAVPNDSGDGEQYYNVDHPAKSKTSVPVKDLWNYVSKKNNDSFKAEFEELPSGMVKPYESAKANMSKNRYRGIYAYDHTRVELSPPDDGGCDYMNANFIDGYERKHGFIASQGATEQNIEDFWLMIWQQRCSTIVMLTNLIEESKVKCLPYWPVEDGPPSCGSVDVSLQKEEVFCNFTIRHLRATKDGESRIVRQYHFTAWPDKGVPSYPSSLVQFHQNIKSNLKDKSHPVVVHCSAGIGRTGTYISLDYLIDEAKNDDAVDVFECVRKLMEQRTNMIQTLDQYIFLHTALVEALHCQGHSMPSDEFRKLYGQITAKNGTRVLEENFQTLEAVYSGYDVTYKEGSKPDNITKNRDQSILPADNERPMLNSNIPGCNNYINAVFLPGLRKRRQFIVTQMPLKNTVIDFWRMVYEQDTKVIVDLSSDPGNFQVFPDKSDLKIGPFTVANKSTEYNEETESTTQTIFVRYKEEHSVMLLKPKFWDIRSNTPKSIPLMMGLIYEVNKYGQHGQNGGIVVICPDGATRCGLFCVTFVSLDRLRVEQEVGAGQIIKQYRSIRPQIIPNKEQLKYCYDVLMFHLNENETYSNFS